MTLKEQFIDAFKSGKRFDIQNAEVIADEFAIDFAEWVIKNYNPEGLYLGILDMEGLIKYYKKETGL